jgi:hypothetical protein
VGALFVVVRLEALEQELQLLQIRRRALVREPLLECAVEALELAERLRVGGSGVQKLDSDLAQAPFEGDLVSEETTGEAQVVVGEELPGKTVLGSSTREAAPGGISARALTGEGEEQEAGVVVQAVDDPG